MNPVRTLLAAVLLLIALAASGTANAQPVQESERHYLSGNGPSNAVPWDFTITGGRRAGEATTIPVPSNWEQHGFGTYEYGQDAKKSANEHGLYELRFAVPERFRGQRLRIVFDGVMTDATVRLNGKQLGPSHQGGFYRFHYDISDVVLFEAGKPNLLQVDVAKVSANAKTEKAERGGDYWVFGGIFRPVWIEARPVESIETVAVDARADGSLTATIAISGNERGDRVEATLVDANNRPVGSPVAVRISAGGAGRIVIAARYPNVSPWTAETPALYRLHLTLFDGARPLHRVTTRIGFRTFEVRPGQGLYLNGKRILLKGVNRHAFRPDTARALDPSDSWDDVRTIKSMNMNAVRMSHYPPDEALLEAADELGLYVIDELSGWHHAHDTQVGRLLVRAMVERDVNHPSILFWANGNEGGWNRDLDGEYAVWDPQRRRVLHPWEPHDDIDTKHYPDFAELTKRLAGPNILMPTEMIHALYDGGGAAGLADYWQAIQASPVGGGGFIWAYADEGVARTDRKGAIDVFGTYAPDGLLGPRHEREASYFAVRDIWAPIVIDPPELSGSFDGALTVHNAYDFLTLSGVTLRWSLRTLPDIQGRGARTIRNGALEAPPVAAGTSAKIMIPLPSNWSDADLLQVTAVRGNSEIRSWTWPIAIDRPPLKLTVPGVSPTIEALSDALVLRAGKVAVTFDAATGFLRHVETDGSRLSLGAGPILDWARPDDGLEPQWVELNRAADADVFRAPGVTSANMVDIALNFEAGDTWARFKIEVSPDGRTWTTIFDGPRRPGDGTRYTFSPRMVSAVRITEPQRANGASIAVRMAKLGFQPARFPGTGRPRVLRSGRVVREGQPVAELEAAGGGFEHFRWTLHGNGVLDLSYSYSLDHPALFHGVSFVQPAGRILGVDRVSNGPYPVWQNRLQGVRLDLHRSKWAGKDADAATERVGYFSGWRWIRIKTADGDWAVERLSGPDHLRVGTRLVNHSFTTVEFPSGDISFLDNIPAIGSKFVAPEDSGPSGKAASAHSPHSGELRFIFD